MLRPTDPDGASDIITVDTPDGPGRLFRHLPHKPIALLLLGHGAGGGIDTGDLAALADQLPAQHIGVARFEQPWRTAGKRLAGPPTSLDRAWRAMLAQVVPSVGDLPLFVGGRSAGARVACRCFAPPARGVVALSFPLHPPGRPDRSRIDELAVVTAPVLVLQGSRDPFAHLPSCGRPWTASVFPIISWSPSPARHIHCQPRRD